MFLNKPVEVNTCASILGDSFTKAVRENLAKAKTPSSNIEIKAQVKKILN